jgi:predicted GTPase
MSRISCDRIDVEGVGVSNQADATIEASTQLSEVLRAIRERALQSQRDDLSARLEPWLEKLTHPTTRVVIVGQFKQGKSSLVNSIVEAPVCPIDDVFATSIPTVIQYGPEPTARLVVEQSGDVEARTIPMDLRSLRDHVTEHATITGSLQGVRAEVNLPRPLLEEGLVLVDTPGIGGTVAAHAASTLSLLPTADVVIVLSDASQEYTEPELSFLRQAATVCPVVLCVMSKVDLEPHWREVAEANRQHLAAAGVEASIVPVSSVLHDLAIAAHDGELDMESGVPALVTHLRDDLRDQATRTMREAAAEEARSVSRHLALALQAELQTLVKPGQSAQVIQSLEEAQAAAADLSRRASRWQQVLNDGFADVIGDVEHDLRERFRRIGREGEQLIDEGDPGEMWEAMSTWLADRFAESVADSFVWAHQRCERVGTTVAEQFALDGDLELPDFQVSDTLGVLNPILGLDSLRSGHETIPQKFVGSLRGSYGGILMAGVITSIAGMALINPISVAAGVLLGGYSYRQESEQRLERRRQEGKVAVRRLVDEAIFHVVKEVRDRLTEVKRLMRDSYSSTADEFKRSLRDSVESAKRGISVEPTRRGDRAEELTAQLGAVRDLMRDMDQLVGSSPTTSRTPPA